MIPLKQSTSVDIPIGPFLDDTDGKTAETALTITQPDIRLKKGAAAWAQKNAAQTLSHEENGWYEVTLDATDTNTIGALKIAVHEVGALPVWQDCWVFAANVYDSIYGAATDKLDVNISEWLGTTAATPTVAGVPEVDLTHVGGAAVSTSTAQIGANMVSGSAGAITAAVIATGAIDADALAADAIDEIWDEAMTELSAVPGVTASLRDAIRWIFLLSRNKITQTGTTQLLRNDADSATVGTSTISDAAGTFTRGEFG